MHPVSKALVGLGFFFIVCGLFYQFGGKFLPLGKLPGDLVIEKPGVKFYFPLVSSLLISLVLSFIFWLFRILGR